MARLKITIEGDMSPDEMKLYLASIWGDLPRDKAEMVYTQTPEENAAVLETMAALPPEPPAPTAKVEGVLSEAKVLELASAGKLSAIVQAIQEAGVTDTEAIVAEVVRIKSAIPGLAKVSADTLADRIPRVLEMMK